MKNILAIVAFTFAFFGSTQELNAQKIDSLQLKAKEKMALGKNDDIFSVDEEMKKYEDIQLNEQQKKALRDNLILKKKVQAQKLKRAEDYKLSQTFELEPTVFKNDSALVLPTRKKVEKSGMKIKRKYSSDLSEKKAEK